MCLVLTTVLFVRKVVYKSRTRNVYPTGGYVAALENRVTTQTYVVMDGDAYNRSNQDFEVDDANPSRVVFLVGGIAIHDLVVVVVGDVCAQMLEDS